jgi:hypothetical protein
MKAAVRPCTAAFTKPFAKREGLLQVKLAESSCSGILGRWPSSRCRRGDLTMLTAGCFSPNLAEWRTRLVSFSASRRGVNLTAAVWAW